MTSDAVREHDLSWLLRPRSIAVVGIASAPGSLAEGVLLNLVRFAYPGVLYGVSRGRDEVSGVSCFASIDALPEPIDVAVLSVPRDGVESAVEACARRGVKAVVAFSAGFAEESDEGRADQQRIAAFAATHGILLVGPNCLGLINYVDGIPLYFGPLAPVPVAARRAAAIVSQSGAMMANAMIALHARDLAVSHAISTGNEAGLSVVDFLATLVDDPHTHILCIFAERIVDAPRFLKLADTARAAGKPMIVLHPGRSEGAREAAQSHTGSLAGDQAVMAAVLAHAGVVQVETLEQFVDVAELFVRNADIPPGEIAILTDSGACKGLMLDYSDTLAAPLATFARTTLAGLAAILPPFATASNPLDATAMVLRDQTLLGRLSATILDDPGVAALIVSMMPDPVDFPLDKVEQVAAAVRRCGKPAAFAVLGGEAAISEGLADSVRSAGATFSRSPERALRALRIVLASRDRHAAIAPRRPARALDPASSTELAMEAGVKRLLERCGVRIPAGRPVETPAQGEIAAAAIGYPVVLKVQSPAIAHKTDVGGVAIGIADAAGLTAAWDRMAARIAAETDVVPEGYLVEAMSPSGAEFVVGARRDPDWGVVMLVGLGGIWLEIVKDTRLFPADLDRAAILAELRSLTAAPLLAGARGKPPLDVGALVDAIVAVADIMAANPALRGFEINPLVVYPDGGGAVALDGLALVDREASGRVPA